ncbi:hypothetical protein HY496_01520 [Candidatus Woesearchaeota archaeon]|nr:hypothetical protein [Candidatus Woesearchaeota archaeon]
MKVKFVLTKGDDIVVEKQYAEEVLRSDRQIVLLMDENGVWTGKGLNKAHIVSIIPVTDRFHNFTSLPPKPDIRFIEEKSVTGEVVMRELHETIPSPETGT